MSTIEFSFIGWCIDTKENHDKVWTAFKAGNTYYAGWGRRGKKLSFKNHGTGWGGENSLNKVRRKKDANISGEYKEVDTFQLFAIFPDFEGEVEKYLTFAVLSNKIK
jgi:hypothetical protein